MKDYYLIKEIAEAHGVTKRTLDYYDKIDLIKPKVIGENGYRMYSYDQFLDLQVILIWKMMGLETSEIKDIMREKTPQKINEIIHSRKKKLHDHIEELLVLEKNLELTEKKIEKLFLIETDKIIIKSYKNEPIEIFDNSHGNIKDNKNIFEIGARAFKLFSQKKLAIIENGFLFSKENIERNNFSDFDHCYYISHETALKKHEAQLKPGEYACMWYSGKISGLDVGIEKVYSWILKNRYVIDGDVIVAEYLSSIYNDKEDDLTGEIRIPINKIIR